MFLAHTKSVQHSYRQMDDLSMWKFNVVLTPDLLKMFPHTVGIENKNKRIYILTGNK